MRGFPEGFGDEQFSNSRFKVPPAGTITLLVFQFELWQVLCETLHRKLESMNHQEVAMLIAHRIPETGNAFKRLTAGGQIFKSMAILKECLRQSVVTHDYKKVRMCLRLADKIYLAGDATVQNAVANVFVYSFSLLTIGDLRESWSRVKADMPKRLYAIYLKQVMQSAV